MSAPTISVCVPCCNSSRYIAQAIESILAQTYSDYEIVVSDDGSTDSTLDVVRRFDDPRIRIRTNERRAGQAGNWNRCVAEAAGRYVVLLHDDDYLERDFLRRAATVLDASPEVGLVHCGVRLVDEQRAELGIRRLTESDSIDPPGVFFRRLLAEGCLVNPAGVMVRNSVYRTVGEFTSAVAWGIDWHMWMRIALRYAVAHLGTVLANYRIHAKMGTTAILRSGRTALDSRWVALDLLSQLPPDTDHVGELRRLGLRGVAHRTLCIAEDLCLAGENRPARKALVRAVEVAPSVLADRYFWGLVLGTTVGWKALSRLVSVKRSLLGARSA